MSDFDRYLASLEGSWRALATPHPEAAVTTGNGWLAMRHPRAVLNNAVALKPTVLDAIVRFFGDRDGYAVWSLEGDQTVPMELERMGFRPDITTRPMVCRLDDLADVRATAGISVVRDVDPAKIADLNGVPVDLVRDVPGIRAYASDDLASGLVIIPVDDDVNVSFVVTRPEARRRGLASAVMQVALIDSHEHGFSTASLQATPMAEQMYVKIGFAPVGRWQEWLPG